ncbi:hypothetical protein ACI513_03615 [Chryseobacterium sp. M5]|uniref:hypothetical protein n=1 Tax=Chryseobacterium sp. M5 TaxID=3379128 RepID=UPI00385793C9
MKKIIIASTTLMCGVLFAAVPNENLKKNTGDENKKTEVVQKDEFCSVSCSTTTQIGSTSITVSESAGNIFTSCTTAAEKCNRKLLHKILDLSENPLHTS